METINGAKLTVIVQIDNDKIQELKAQGYSDKEIENAVKRSITLTDINMRQPVFDIESVELVKYY